MKGSVAGTIMAIIIAVQPETNTKPPLVPCIAMLPIEPIALDW
jgi:hypothetical protein